MVSSPRFQAQQRIGPIILIFIAVYSLWLLPSIRDALAADLAGSKRMQYPANVRIIHAPCTGKIEMEHILEAFEKGIDGILVEIANAIND